MWISNLRVIIGTIYMFYLKFLCPSVSIYLRLRQVPMIGVACIRVWGEVINIAPVVQKRRQISTLQLGWESLVVKLETAELDSGRGFYNRLGSTM